MRPNNSNKRVRSRNRSKSSNPLSRNYESNGPDVKIRGSAVQVADKYAQLARDAQSSGDRVTAENYLQHAEHYYRIVAAAQEQGGQQQPRDRREDDREPRFEDRANAEQPSINGFDGIDDDVEGVRRPHRANGGSTRNGHDPSDHAKHETIDAQENEGESIGHSNGRVVNVAADDADEAPEDTPAHVQPPSLVIAEDDVASEGDADIAASADEAEAPKPKRRTRTPRTRRPRKQDPSASPAAEVGEAAD